MFRRTTLNHVRIGLFVSLRRDWNSSTQKKGWDHLDPGLFSCSILHRSSCREPVAAGDLFQLMNSSFDRGSVHIDLGRGIVGGPESVFDLAVGQPVQLI